MMMIVLIYLQKYGTAIGTKATPPNLKICSWAGGRRTLKMDGKEPNYSSSGGSLMICYFIWLGTKQELAIS